MQGRVTVASVPGLYIDANRRKIINIPFASSKVRCNVADTVYVCTGSFPCPLSAMNRDTSTSIHFPASPVPCVRSTNLSHRLVFFSLDRRRCRNCSSKVNYILSDFCAERELNLCRIVQNWRYLMSQASSDLYFVLMGATSFGNTYRRLRLRLLFQVTTGI